MPPWHDGAHHVRRQRCFCQVDRRWPGFAGVVSQAYRHVGQGAAGCTRVTAQDQPHRPATRGEAGATNVEPAAAQGLRGAGESDCLVKEWRGRRHKLHDGLGKRRTSPAGSRAALARKNKGFVVSGPPIAAHAQASWPSSSRISSSLRPSSSSTSMEMVRMMAYVGPVALCSGPNLRHLIGCVKCQVPQRILQPARRCFSRSLALGTVQALDLGRLVAGLERYAGWSPPSLAGPPQPSLRRPDH